MRFLTLFLVVAMFSVTTPISLAQSSARFQVDAMVSDGKKSKEVKSFLSFSSESFEVSSKKSGVVSKSFNYADVEAADYSYSKKPILSTGGAVAMAILTGLVVIPFLFVKKKSHWLSVRTDDDYIVMKLDRENYRQVISEFEIKKVAVKTVDEDDKKKEK